MQVEQTFPEDEEMTKKDARLEVLKETQKQIVFYENIYFDIKISPQYLGTYQR